MESSQVLQDILANYIKSLLRDVSRRFKIPYKDLQERYTKGQPQAPMAHNDQDNACTKEALLHNHLPVRFLVPECPYCMRHGNVLMSLDD